MPDSNATRIPLTQNQFALIDECDVPVVSAYRWHAWWNRCTQSFYAVRSHYDVGISRTVYMHRLIMNAAKGITVDHRDHNTLDNRRSNLRLATRSQQAFNTKIQARNTSGHRGVSFCKRTGMWMVRMTVDGKFIWLGRHESLAEAIDVYDSAAMVHHGDFRYLTGGFPVEVR